MRSTLGGLGLALAVAVTVTLYGSADATRFVERLATCKAACGSQVDASCGSLRRAKLRKCRARVWKQCQRVGLLAVCPPPTTTTTTPPATVPGPGVTTTTRPLVGAPTTSTTITTPTTATFPPTTTTTIPLPVCGGNLLLFADDGTLTYLGCITCSEFSSDSIFNEFGAYGSEFSSTSINNQFGTYGNPFGVYSACNQFSQHPPVIVDEGTCIVGLFSVNQFVSGSVCGVLGSAVLCDAVTALCVQ